MEYCKYCGKECKNKISKASHERFCKNNINRIDMSGKNNPRYGKSPPNKRSKTALFKLRKIVLTNKTVQEVEDYKKEHVCCEICGKSNGILCIDHDHKTNEFRGILCQSCNRFLGWFDNNKEKVIKYLKKKI